MTLEIYELLMDDAVYFEEQDMYTRAIEIYEYLLHYYPKEEEILKRLGDLYLEIETYKKAIVCYKTIIYEGLHPKMAHYHASIAICYMYLYEREENSTNLKNAFKHFKRMYQLNPEVGEGLALYEFAYAYVKIQKYKKAANLLEEALEYDDMTPEIYNLLSFCFIKQGEYKKAIEHVNIAIAIDPKEPLYYYRLGQVHHHMENYEQAISAYGESIKLNSEFSDVYTNLSDAYIHTGKVKKAVKCAKRATKLDPQSSLAYCNLAEGYEKLNDISKAKRCFKKSLQLMPDFLEAREGLERVLRFTLHI